MMMETSMQADYRYLCQGFGRLAGLEARIYKNNAILARYSPVAFEPDVAQLILHRLDPNKGSAYFLEVDLRTNSGSGDLLLFGVIHCQKDGSTIILGPTAQVRPQADCSINVLCALSEPYSRLREMQTYFEYLIPYPLEAFLSIICLLNYAINDEELSVSDLIRDNSRSVRANVPEYVTSEEDVAALPRNSYLIEKEMLSYVAAGDVSAVEEFVSQPPTGKAGKVAGSALRQQKNTFICAATLISRAAMEGGMPPEAAFSLSDRYIQKAEILPCSSDIALLSIEMLRDYTKRVAGIRYGLNNSRLAKAVFQYIQRNPGEKINTACLARTFSMNRSYLCTRFREETGKTIGEFVAQVKIDKAKNMLTASSLSLAQISEYLAFSSQSHFQRVFKSIVGATPLEYRKTNAVV